MHFDGKKKTILSVKVSACPIGGDLHPFVFIVTLISDSIWIHFSCYIISRAVLFTGYCGILTVLDFFGLPKHLEKELLMTQLKCTFKKFTY